jgi:hypothetical protein
MIRAANEAVTIKFDFIKKIIPKHLMDLGQNSEKETE